jgi:hypothetical protein
MHPFSRSYERMCSNKIKGVLQEKKRWDIQAIQNAAQKRAGSHTETATFL